MELFFTAVQTLSDHVGPCWAFSLLLSTAAVLPTCVLVPLFTWADATDAWPHRRHIPASKSPPSRLISAAVIETFIGVVLSPLTLAAYYVIQSWTIEGFAVWRATEFGHAVLGAASWFDWSAVSDSWSPSTLTPLSFAAISNPANMSASSMADATSVGTSSSGSLPFGFATAHALLSFDAAPPWWVCLLQVAACMFFKQTVFYTAHRILHDVRGLYSIHRKHHDFVAPSSAASHWFGPTEVVISVFLPHFPLAWALQLHIVPAMLFFFMAEVDAVVIHSGYDVPAWMWPVCDTRMHTFHHTHGQGAFGTTFFWDWACGTDRHYKRYLQQQRVNAKATPPSGDDCNPQERDASMPRVR